MTLSHYLSALLTVHFICVCSASETPASVPKLSNAQISEHYSTCIKLSTENVRTCTLCVYVYLSESYDLKEKANQKYDSFLFSFLAENHHQKCFWSSSDWLHGWYSQTEGFWGHKLQGLSILFITYRLCSHRYKTSVTYLGLIFFL